MNLDDLPPEKQEAFVTHMMNECGIQTWVKGMDNKELVWRLYRAMKADGLPFDGLESALWGEMEERLCPEYDGDTVQMTENGWKTPEGEIRYP